MSSGPIVARSLVPGWLLNLMSDKFIFLIGIVSDIVFVCENFRSILRRYDFLFLFCQYWSVI